MKTYICTKHYKKENAEIKKAITLSANNLTNRIMAYEQQNIKFENIFNDDYVKYDKHGDFYTFKSQKCNMQIRILYAYIIVDNEAVLMIADYYVKKKNDKRYINRFDSMNDVNPVFLMQNTCRYEII